MKIVVLDIETTGLYPDEHMIVEIGLIKLYLNDGNDRVFQEFERDLKICRELNKLGINKQC